MRNPRAKLHVGKRSCLTLAAIAIAIVAAGCSHRVVASPGEHTVRVYPDQATYAKAVKRKSQGGAMGMLGGIGANMAAKEADDKTPLRSVTSTAEAMMTDGTSW